MPLKLCPQPPSQAVRPSAIAQLEGRDVLLQEPG